MIKNEKELLSKAIEKFWLDHQKSIELMGPELYYPLADVKNGTCKTEEAMRFNEGKLRFDLIPPEAEIELARVYTAGSAKYEDNNWVKGMPYSERVASIKRHLIQWQSGQDIDPDTGCLHMASIAWNALSLIVWQINKSGTDDRRKFAIDEKFNWVDNHLGISFNDDKFIELKNKYKEFKK